MIDYGTPLRKAYFNVLDGNLTALSSPVPVVDEKLDPGQADIYVKIGTTDEQQQNNKSYFAGNCNVTLDIVQRTESVGSKIVVDDVSNQILALLFTDIKTTTLQVEAPLKLSFAKLEATKTEPLKQIESGFMIVKRLSFTNRVYQ